MSPRNADLLVASLLFSLGIALIVASLTWATNSAIWFLDEFEGDPDLVMDNVASVAISLIFGIIAHYCIKRAVQVWQTTP